MFQIVDDKYIALNIQQCLDKYIVSIGRKINLIILVVFYYNPPPGQCRAQARPHCGTFFHLAYGVDSNFSSEWATALVDVRNVYPVMRVKPEPQHKAGCSPTDEVYGPAGCDI